MKGQPIIGETRFIINGQLYSPEQIGEQRAMELIRQKVDQARRESVLKRHTRKRPPEGGERRTSLWKQVKNKCR